MLSGPQRRVQHLRSLTVGVYTWENDDDHDDESIEEVPIGPYGNVFSQVNLLADLLVHANNLKEFDCQRFQPCLLKDPRIGSALQAMTQLTSLRLYDIGDTSLAFIRGCKASLKSLYLEYYSPNDYPLHGETKTLPALLSAIAPFQGLRTLETWHLTPATSLEFDFEAAEMPSISYLRLSDSTPYALDIVRFCPNLSTLVFSRDDQHAASASGSLKGPRWPPLRRLMIQEYNDIPSILGRVHLVDCLHIAGQIPRSGEDDEEVAQCLELIRVASPVELYLSVVVRATPLTFLTELARVAPRLRVLELKVTVESPIVENESWLDVIPESVRSLTIPCLRIYLPQLPWYPLRPYVYGNVDRSERRERIIDALRMEAHRAQAPLTLPHRLIEAVPSLRYVAILDSGPNKFILELAPDVDDPPNDLDLAALAELEKVAQFNDEDDSSEDEEDEDWSRTWDELRGTDHFVSYTWWQVAEEADGRVVKPITIEEGERVQRQFLERGL
ncbi:hypothetical protein BN946_scf184939.g15 [Trametes cinnabarina]|uniref:F-box domain-containing protein n=1 Tax=Pycnoporus cinnabarinus TaxID=5643 RepID=A0A060SC81_PYCCI|nr:hypothetical protein BN946_scf184939.g15 [Trametes cinnabarina]